MNKLYFENFRLFKERTELDLAPITILTGRNSSGKSSILKSLLLLANYLENDKNQLTLNLSEQQHMKHKINKLENTFNWYSESKTFTIGFEQDNFQFEFSFSGQKEEAYALFDKLIIQSIILNDSLVLERLSVNQFNLTVSQTFIDHVMDPTKFAQRELFSHSEELRDAENLLKVINEKIHSAVSKDIKHLINERQALEQRIKLIAERIRIFENKDKSEGVVFKSEIQLEEDDVLNYSLINLIRRGVFKYMEDDPSGEKKFRFVSRVSASSGMFRFAENLTRRMSFTAYHLSPNRTHQARLYYLFHGNLEINEIINQFSAIKLPSASKAKQFLSKWLKFLCEGEDIKVENIDAEACTVKVLKKKKWIDLADLGFGTGQVITQLLKIVLIIHQKTARRQSFRTIHRNRHTIVLIEEPESNLHPQLQSMLTEMFVEATREFDIQFILEIHSEYMIRKLQVLVAEKKISESICNIYYIDILPEKNQELRKITISETGALSEPFGEGFFDEADKHSMDLFRLQKRMEK